ncbi:MAG: hypothetical protein OQK56_07370 [Ignavibacteriaceae bacterium]|nr:hypothetical protein [Ignavibacteriaceae bacterium]
MKKTKNLMKLFLAAVLLIVLSIACEGPEGPAGPEGPQGPPGESYVNWEGYAEGIVCAQCHNYDYDTVYFVWGRKYQWAISKHAIGGDFERNSSTCAGCHTTEGFIEDQMGMPVSGNVNASPPGCFACHSPHSRADFSLRTTDPVMVNSAVAGVPDFEFNYGDGNLCVACHKTRSLSPEPDPTKTAITDTINITSSRWYPHYGVNGQMLAGTGGFEFEGKQYSNSYHTSANLILEEGCKVCHMADPNAGTGQGGGHTMMIRYEGTHGEDQELTTGCLTPGCHSEPFEVDYHGVQTETEELLDSLHTLLIDRGWLTSSGLVNASSSNPLKIAPESLSGALFNYFFIEHDLSEGVHNTNYATQLLNDSIEMLNNNP